VRYADALARAEKAIAQGLVSRFEEFRMKAARNLIAIFAAVLVVDAAAAQSAFPDRPVHILVGYVAGGPNDIIARAIGDRLAVAWGKSVVIDNVPGATAISRATVSLRPRPTATAASRQYGADSRQSEPVREDEL